MRRTLLIGILNILFTIFAIAGGDYIPISNPTSVTKSTKDRSGAYIGVGYSYLKATLDNYRVNGVIASGETDTTTNGGLFIIGYQYSDFLSLEARYTTQMVDSDDSGPISARTKVNHTKEKATNIALYLKPQYRYDRLVAYGLLGYGWLRGESKRDDRSATDTQGTFEWGLGFSFNLSEHSSVFIDYSKFTDATIKEDGGDLAFDVSSDNYSAGLIYKF